MKISNGNDIIPALPLYIAIADDDINYNYLILKKAVVNVSTDISTLTTRIIISIEFDNSVREINLAEVTNQPTWTNDEDGSITAKIDIDLWVNDNSTSNSTSITDGTTTADVFDLTNSNPLAVAIVDNNGNQINSFGGGTQYSDGDANANPTGTVAMGTDGSNVFALHTDTAGDLQVDVVTMPVVDVQATNLDIRDLAFSSDKVDVTGSTVGIGASVLPTGAATAANQQTNALTDTELRATPVPVSSTNLDVRDLVFATDKVDASGTVLGAGNNNIGDVDIASALPAGNNNIGDVDVASIIPGTGATNLGKAEDAAHTTGDTGVMLLGVSNEGGSALVNANGDYTPIATDKMGQIYVNPENNKVLFRGRSSSFRTLGRAGTSGQKILAIHNATGSLIAVKVKKITVDMFCTVIKAITVAPPIVRIWKFTALPTNGTTLTKNKIGGTTTSDASATVRGDSSADGTGSGTTLTVTLPVGTILDQKVAPRVITGAGEISTSALEFDYPDGIQLGPLEGVCVFLDYTTATQNPTTDMWTASIQWEEFIP